MRGEDDIEVVEVVELTVVLVVADGIVDEGIIARPSAVRGRLDAPAMGVPGSTIVSVVVVVVVVETSTGVLDVAGATAIAVREGIIGSSRSVG